MQVGDSAQQALTLLRSSSVEQIVRNLRRLIEVPFNASIRDTLNTMQASDILAVAVAAPPGQWIGAGGSKILEADKATGTVRKHYIGMVSVLDILVHIVLDNAQMNAPVSKVIGHSLESLNLWTISPSTSVHDAIEPMSKGVHRVLVPFESEQDGVESEEASSGYHILTQTDILQFIFEHAKMFDGLLRLNIADVGAVKRSVMAVPHTMPVMDAFKCMASGLLPAVAIVLADHKLDIESMLINGEGRKLIGTISASDLRGCNRTSDALSSWSSMSVLEWSQKVWVSKHFGAGAAIGPDTNVWQVKPPVTCRLGTSLGEAMSLALENHIHRVWITSEQGLLMGLVALSDILSVFHKLPQTINNYSNSQGF